MAPRKPYLEERRMSIRLSDREAKARLAQYESSGWKVSKVFPGKHETKLYEFVRVCHTETCRCENCKFLRETQKQFTLHENCKVPTGTQPKRKIKSSDPTMTKELKRRYS